MYEFENNKQQQLNLDKPAKFMLSNQQKEAEQFERVDITNISVESSENVAIPADVLAQAQELFSDDINI
jgi:hypothetical protein